MPEETEIEIEPDEYIDDRAVFLVEDGERHWYVADDAAQALAAHLSLMEPEDDEFTVTKMAPSKSVDVCLDRDDARRYPESFGRVEPDEDDKNPWFKVRATAAQWAAFEKSGAQICSSCFP